MKTLMMLVLLFAMVGCGKSLSTDRCTTQEEKIAECFLHEMQGFNHNQMMVNWAQNYCKNRYPLKMCY